jgi:hypothetical protein
MRPFPYILSVFTLSTAILFETAAMAADLPKEGSFSGTYSGFATFKAAPIGKDRILIVWDDNGMSLGKGIVDHATWHGFGLDDIASGMVRFSGYYVTTDRDGDQIVANMAERTGAADAKSFNGSATLTTGTGKYAGITGDYTYVCMSPNEFRTATQGTFAYGCTLQGSYKIP